MTRREGTFVLSEGKHFFSTFLDLREEDEELGGLCGGW